MNQPLLLSLSFEPRASWIRPVFSSSFDPSTGSGTEAQESETPRWLSVLEVPVAEHAGSTESTEIPCQGVEADGIETMTKTVGYRNLIYA